MHDRLLTKSVKILLLLVLIVIVVVYSKPFLAPLAFAGLFSFLLLPVSVKIESWGVGRGLAIFLSILLFLLLISAIVSVMVWQVSDMAKQSSEIEHNLNEKIMQFRNYVSHHFGLSMQKQDELLKKSGSASNGKISGFITLFFTSLGSLLTDFILMLVYIFLFMYLRGHLKKFILIQVPASEKKNAQTVISDARDVVLKYVTGMAWMILSLWIMYSIGFSIVGVKHAIFFAVLCGILEIVPFVGNLTGNLITVFAVVMQGGSGTMILGVLITYAIVQFLQTYILEPLVVGKGVSINPLFTIAGIVAGELLWGVAGMILAIPSLAIAKIICDHVPQLKPYGLLIGEEKKSRSGIMDKIKSWFK